MFFVRTYFDYGPNYISDDTKRSSLYLAHYGEEFWHNLPVVLKSMYAEGKILFRARREDNEWGMCDTVYRDRAAYEEYSSRINGPRIEEGLTNMGYTLKKEMRKIESVEEVLALPEPMYVQLGEGVEGRTL